MNTQNENNRKEILEILSLSDEELDEIIETHEQSFRFYLYETFGLEIENAKEFVLNNGVVADDVAHYYKTAVIIKHLLNN